MMWFELFHMFLPYLMFLFIVFGMAWACYLGMLNAYERRRVKQILRKIMKIVGDRFGKSHSKGKHS